MMSNEIPDQDQKRRILERVELEEDHGMKVTEEMVDRDLLELTRLREARPIAWIVTYDMKQSGSQASAYVKEDEARRAALNVEKYADASNVKVLPAYALSSHQGKSP